MFSRRNFITTLVATTAASTVPKSALAAPPRIVHLDKKYFPTMVDVNPELPAGEIHVVKDDFFLYLTHGNGRAERYGVALGNDGRNYTGLLTIRRKAKWPKWRPTQNMIKLEPELYRPYSKGLPGGHPNNPMGSRAMYLYNGRQATYYRIHGTMQPWTIGTKFSSGCVRLVNEHIDDLYDSVPVGTKVYIF